MQRLSGGCAAALQKRFAQADCEGEDGSEHAQDESKKGV